MNKVLKKCILGLIAVVALQVFAQSEVIIGDVNNDGAVDVADISAVITTMAGDEPYDNADVNGDGGIDVADISMIISIMAGGQGSDVVEGDSTITINYMGSVAEVIVAKNVEEYVTVINDSGHVTIAQDAELPFEITYVLSGESQDGEFAMSGNYKATVELRGLTLTNSKGAAINITNGKRIALSAKKGTVNTFADGKDGEQKAAIYCKGHLELKGQGTLNVTGNTAHAIKSGDYMSMKNCTVNVLSAVKDGLSANEFFLMESGTLNISGVGDDGIQVDLDGEERTGITEDHEDEDSGNIYIEGGTLNITLSSDGGKGMKAVGDVYVSGGTLDVTQTGSLVVEESDLSYPTSIKAGGNIDITSGTITINNTADGGKGMSADGTLTIGTEEADSLLQIPTVDITVNGKGGVAEITQSSEEAEEVKSYKVYVTLPTGGQGGGPGGGNAWRTVYLYKSDGTLVQQLTQTVTKSNATFYYYDFKAEDDGSYYFKADNYTSRNTTYTILSENFAGPTSGSDVYYQITNSYTTSGTTRTYKLTNVTSTYSGTSDAAEEEGTGYNAAGLKADGNLTINAGTITIKNSGSMSKSIKSKATATINGGDITLTPSGGMQVINSDASYSIGIKTEDFEQNGGTLTIKSSGQAGRGISANNITTNGGTLNITNSGAGVTGTNDDYTAKGLKADGDIKLNAGDITITMSGTGGKGIKCNGTFTEGTSDGEGPTLKVTTTGTKLTSSSGGGMGGPGGGWGQTSGGGSAKGIKVQGTITLYGGTTEVSTSTDGAEGLESKTSTAESILIKGGHHYFKCYDDCINSAGGIKFDGGITICYGYGNDAVDSNYGRSGAVDIGNGFVMAYTSRGAPEEGLDCDNDSYVKISGNGYAISGGAQQGGGGGWGGSSSSTISGAAQGYAILSSPSSYNATSYYTLADADGNNLMTYKFDASFSNSHSIITAKGMVKGSKYTIKSSDEEPTDATESFHGVFLGSTAQGTTTVVSSFTAQ
ncbi:MAG: carbohydrate-binding domain-containing protein [Prevotella sp.]|nr:carbohydrate-binding domain-containing protein [Prevotella sp.]